MTQPLSAKSPKYRVIQDGTGLWHLQILGRSFGCYWYEDLATYEIREEATTRLYQLKKELAEKQESKEKHNTIVREIY